MSIQSTTTNPTRSPLTDPATLHEHFVAACNAGDLDALLDLYEPGAVIVERTGELTTGHEEVRAHIAALLAMKPVMRIIASTTAVNGDVALSSSHWQCRAVAPDATVIDLEYRGSELARRQPDGTWRLVIDNPWGAQ